MGLLSDPDRRQKIVNTITNYNNKLCFICYVAGLVWFLALAYKPLNANTYFSENALLPGLVDSHFHSGAVAEKYYEELKVEMKKDKRAMPVKWIEEQFQNLGLDTFVQNYTFTYPYNIIGDKAAHGANVYGILRAPRAASTEAVVLSVPFRPPVVDTLPKSHGGLALMLAAAQHFRKSTHWAKDIIFLVTQQEQVGMQAWLDAYHSSTQSEFIQGGDLLGRSGSIQAAINLEIASNKITDLSLKLQGLNGQLPNLDLVNLVTRLCNQHSIRVRIHDQSNYYDPESLDGYLHSLKTMVTMMWYQVSGVQLGNHGLFHRYHIEALTITGLRKKGAQTRDFVPIGRIVEGVFRSLNNLLERFHQSFFFYLMPATDRYVSIGLYMPPFGLLAVGVLIKAIALWVNSSFDAMDQQKTSEQSDKEKTDTAEGTSSESKESEDDKTEETKPAEEGSSSQSENNDQAKTGDSSKTRSQGLLSLLPVLIICWVFSISAYRFVGVFVDSAQTLRMSPSDGVFYGFVAMFVTSAILLARKISMFDFDVVSLKCVTLIFEGLVLASVSLMNISLATLVAVVWVPVSVVTTATNSRFYKCVQSALLLLVSPLSLLLLGTMAHEYFINKTTDVTVFSKACVLAKESLLSIVLDGLMLGNWAFGLACLTLYPIWLMLWTLVHCGVKHQTETVEEKAKTE